MLPVKSLALMASIDFPSAPLIPQSFFMIGRFLDAELAYFRSA